ncbi:phospholipase D family protein [Pseudoluteimonas lycopersici]|uniref:Phospholipase D family protein n=1 Tax=Pseudoluteimonas lycopersici TaxID=1324796 RepID=A0A516V638_9GAMM|nr:phospholipase D family protein [Lysobacter lycopersici]QDQ73990.1 phospholipase D family protein [Lysobacter lycopersici]
MAAWRAIAAAMLALALSACVGLGPAQRERAEAVVEAGRSDASSCDSADACAQSSPLHQLAADAFAESANGTPRHRALILDDGRDALLARVNLIRSATTSIDLQTYIFEEDDAGRLMLDELLAAAKRGVRVRVLIDQLSALERVQTLAALAGAHRNFQIRIYNPVLQRARISYPMYLLASACCWHKLNHRMHSKLLLIDGAIGITGGRNYQDDYYDWDADYNFRDRDLLVAGPVARDMAANFDAFWASRRSVPVEQLADVGGMLLEHGIPALPDVPYEMPERVVQLSGDASDQDLAARLAGHALDVGAVRFIADLPEKSRDGGHSASTGGLRELVESARDEVLLQTPYLVLSKPAQQMFRELHARAQPPRVVVSTNSLASTDSFITYALSYKYKRRYLRDFGFEIHEVKPFPGTVPASLLGDGGAPGTAGSDVAGAATDADEAIGGKHPTPLMREYAALRFAGVGVNKPLPLTREGARRGLHAKSMVIDGRIGVVGTHNFDPRGDAYNTESALVIDDPAFARALEASIDGDMLPGNAWTIARRNPSPILPGIEYTLAKLSERMPLFDLWPVRYATSYDFVPGPECPGPLPPNDPHFRQCYRAVGDFPEVSIGFKSLLTRIFTAFGAGLAPIL